MLRLSGAGAFTRPPGDESAYWIEHLRSGDLSVGTYSLARDGTDDQQPHTEDEIYVVTAGRAVLEGIGQPVTAEPGSVLFVPAGEPHRFTGITEDFAALVVFAPPEDSRREPA
jgi:quercetin dioxygenase-like cupin family protein